VETIGLASPVDISTMIVSTFKTAWDAENPVNVNITEVFDWIRNGKAKPDIEKIRQKQSALIELVKGSDEYTRIDKEKEALKKKLLSIVFQGRFNHRSINGLAESSQIATLDFDHVKDPFFLRDFMFDSYSFVHAAFVSPSGDGVKVLVRIPQVESDQDYKDYYIVLLNYFDDAKQDSSTKDISRICFISYDPDIKVREWDKTTVFVQKQIKEKYLPETEPVNVKNKSRAIDTARRMIQQAPEGQMHFTLLKAARLMGGYIATQAITQQDAVQLLENEIKKKPIRSLPDAVKTIHAGIKHGINSPIRNESFYYNSVEPKPKPDKNYNDALSSIKIKRDTFPIEVFPELVQSMITELNRCLNYPVDFTASGFLALFSSIIRNSLKVQVEPGYIDSATIWLMQIGEPGSIKTYPLQTLYKPLQDVEHQLVDNYKQLLAEWKQQDEKPPKPKQKELIVKDFTIEMLGKTLDQNPIGVALYVDELKAWIDGMGKYSKTSNDIQIWLSIFGNSSIKITRKTQDVPVFIHSPFVSIAGTIQPDELIGINNKHRGNGFFDRFLFCYPDVSMNKRTRQTFDTMILTEYEQNIKTFYNYIENMYRDSDSREMIIKFDQQAQDIYYRMDDWIVDLAHNQRTNAALKSYLSKLRTYLPRLALIVETISCFHNGYLVDVITPESVRSAGKLIRYFYFNAELIYGKFNEKEDVDSYINGNKSKSKQSKVYELHEQGVPVSEIAKTFKVAEATVYTMIRREKGRN